jgi:CRISPR-associated protein Cmr1
MEVRIQTLTPLWTGGVQAGKVDRIHETGILGSMRWWYEAIVRGLGGECCDPSHTECAFTEEKYLKSQAVDKRQKLHDAGLCDVCQVLGATGWKRRLRLAIQDSTRHDPSIEDRLQANRSYVGANGRSRTPIWYFPKELNYKPCSGELSIGVQSLSNDFDPKVIAGLVQFIADWAGMGARAQMGFGVVQLAKGRVDTRPLYNYMQSVAGSHPYFKLPTLQNIFLARILPKDERQFDEKETFNLKYDLRRLFAQSVDDTELRHFVMGTTRGTRIAAKVKMSRPYNGGKEMRVWGWVPKELPNAKNFKNRNDVVQAIHQHLTNNYTVQVWREMNSARDTVVLNNNDVMTFLRTLLKLEEDRHA